MNVVAERFDDYQASANIRQEGRICCLAPGKDQETEIVKGESAPTLHLSPPSLALAQRLLRPRPTFFSKTAKEPRNLLRATCIKGTVCCQQWVPAKREKSTAGTLTTGVRSPRVQCVTQDKTARFMKIDEANKAESCVCSWREQEQGQARQQPSSSSSKPVNSAARHATPAGIRSPGPPAVAHGIERLPAAPRRDFSQFQPLLRREQFVGPVSGE